VVVTNGKFADLVMQKTHGSGVDVVLELVGGGYVSEDIACAARKARIVLVGLVAGASADLNFGAMLQKRIRLQGTNLRNRPLEEKIAAGRTFADRVMPLVASGKCRAIVDRVLPLERAREAHEVMQKNETFGKVVLTIERASSD
ncbi:MAG: zinc-binding dehydrogenase, partial [Polyangiaceae bacterium]